MSVDPAMSGSGAPGGALAPPGTHHATGQGLRLRGLTVGYRGGWGRPHRNSRAILADLSLSADPGAVTMLLGPNGSGKSTLLRTVACLQPALAGRVEVDGSDLTRMSPRARARALAVVLTERFDPGLLTGGEIVALGRHPHLGAAGSLSPADRAAVADALAVMHAEDLAPVRVAELSDGQRQRIMVARALAQQPRLLVLDEPTAFLDAPARIELLERLRVIAAARNIAVVLSTHDVETALRAGGVAWLIGPGADRRAVTSGRIEDLAASGAINSSFDSAAVAFHPTSGTFRLR
jgi:iron complex transport system ATP-binding protein